MEIGGTYTTEDYHAHKTLTRTVREQDGAIQLYRAELGEYSDQVRDLIATNDDLRTELARLMAYAESIEDAKNHRAEAAEKRVKEQDEELGRLRLEVDAQIALREAAEKELESYKETRLKLLEAERDNGLLRDKFDEMSCAYGDLVAERDGLRAKLKAAEDMLFTINSKLGADWVQKLAANLKEVKRDE